jgi:hypothetical protein
VVIVADRTSYLEAIARDVCEAIGSKNGHGTILGALYEVQAGARVDSLQRIAEAEERGRRAAEARYAAIWADGWRSRSGAMYSEQSCNPWPQEGTNG